MLFSTYFSTLFTKLGFNAGQSQAITVPKLAFVEALCDLLKIYEAVDLDNNNFMHDLCTKLNVEDTKEYRKAFKKLWKKMAIRKMFVHRILEDNRKVENYRSEEYNEDELYQEFADQLSSSVGYVKSQSGIGDAALLRNYQTDDGDSSVDEIIVYVHDSYTSTFERGVERSSIRMTPKGIRV